VGAFFEPVAIPDCAFPAVIGHLKILRQFQRIGWAGILFSRGAPRNRSATIGRSGGYCSVQILSGCCVLKVTHIPFRKLT
jgi:hypothetical protein